VHFSAMCRKHNSNISMAPATTGLTIIFKVGGNILSFKNRGFESNGSVGSASFFNSWYRYYCRKNAGLVLKFFVPAYKEATKLQPYYICKVC
jgi:hypothetical protein